MKDKINGFKEAMNKVEKDFRTNTLEKTLERLWKENDSLSYSVKNDIETGSYLSKLKRYHVGGTVEGKLPIKGDMYYGHHDGTFFKGSIDQVGYMAGILSEDNLVPDLNPDDYRLTPEENEQLNNIEPPEDLF